MMNIKNNTENNINTYMIVYIEIDLLTSTLGIKFGLKSLQVVGETTANLGEITLRCGRNNCVRNVFERSDRFPI